MSNISLPKPPPMRVVFLLGFLALLLFVLSTVARGRSDMRQSFSLAGGVPRTALMQGTAVSKAPDLFHMVSRDANVAYRDESAVYGYDMMAPSLPPVPVPVPADLSAPMSTERIARTVQLNLIVQDTNTAIHQIDDIRLKYAGYAGDSSFFEFKPGVRQGTMTIWIPRTSLDAALSELRAIAVRVNLESVSADDVSRQHADIEARLKIAKMSEEQYLEIMKRTGEINDVLQVAQALSATRAEIESLQSMLGDVDQRVDYSSVTISLIPESSPGLEASDWDPLQIASDAFTGAISDLKIFGAALITGLIRIFYFFPILLFYGLTFWVLVLAGKRAYRILRPFAEKL